VGFELGRGHTLAEILASTNMVAEGVETTYAAAELSTKLRVEMPITHEMNLVLREGKSPRKAIRDLMDRQLRCE
jgi:glycerol-3-phosphate dehydrogenase (NAD(P)+)